MHIPPQPPPVDSTKQKQAVLLSALSESLQGSVASPNTHTSRSPGMVTAACVHHLGQQLMSQSQSRRLICDYQLAISMVHLAEILQDEQRVNLPSTGRLDAKGLKEVASTISPMIKDEGLIQAKHQFRSTSPDREVELLTREVQTMMTEWCKNKVIN
ncbi:MAG TPA: hypothetical protein VFV57_07920 [Limnobacter sp.]|nr:hypothetical protein [Limnobacter sp.]